MLEAAMGEMDCRFREGGSRVLGRAFSEGIAALDRIGDLCFTSDPMVLPTKAMRILRIMDSLRAFTPEHIELTDTPLQVVTDTQLPVAPKLAEHESNGDILPVTCIAMHFNKDNHVQAKGSPVG
ncbi:hypothetical protein QL093DRAFT_2107347 [Fusarium oxysporum]|nr:hypothetical protein FOWG_17756 [Fusarium oxysporum f. sp. lycopersici MN25]KAJ9413471.1 hypothetical protein QL093DRAFT_2107347 [Fusarium oxysporum]